MRALLTTDDDGRFWYRSITPRYYPVPTDGPVGDEVPVAEAGDDLACIFAAPFKHDAFIDQAEPDLAYAKRARELCDQTGALLIIDDVRAGLRLARDCSWSKIGVQPDLSTWGKCLANGHGLSALLGNDKARKAASKPGRFSRSPSFRRSAAMPSRSLATSESASRFSKPLARASRSFLACAASCFKRSSCSGF